MSIFKLKTNRIVYIALFSILVTLFSTSLSYISFAQDWEEVVLGIVRKEYNYVLDDKSKLTINVVRIDPAKWKVQVIDVYGALKKQKGQFYVYSIKELISILKPQVIINGGFTASYSIPIPAGLLVESKKIVTRLNSLSETQTGVFCIGKTGYKIIKKEEYGNGDCDYALQAGPVLIEYPAKIVVYKNEPRKYQKYRRSIVAIDRRGRLLLITTSEGHLYDIAKFLVKSDAEGGLDCMTALNLSGDVQSGIYMSHKGKPIVDGNIDVPIASAIAVFKK